MSDVRRDYVRPLLGGADAKACFGAMEEQAREDMDDPELRRRADLRYRGQSFELTVEADDLEAIDERFGEVHERRYGYRMDGEGIELVNARLIATEPVERPELSEPEPDGDADAGTRRANFDGDWQEVPVLRRAGMGEGTKVEGPAIVEFAEATCVVRPGWSGAIDGAGTLVLERS
jgi:N-methylhydantoinase A